MRHNNIIGSNPDKETTPCLEIEFDRFSNPVAYPPEQQIEEVAQLAASKESPLIYLVGLDLPVVGSIYKMKYNFKGKVL